MTESWTYTVDREVETFTDGRGKVWSRFYDGYGRVRETRDPLGRRELIEYDDAGMPTRVRRLEADGNLLSQSESVYDVRKRLTEQSEWIWPSGGRNPGDPPVEEPPGDAGIAVTRYEYDGLSNPRKTIDPMGRETVLFYDAAERRKQVVDAAGNEIESFFDPAGNPLLTRGREMLPGGGAVDVTELRKFDALGRPVEVTNGAGETVRTILDARGNPRFVIDPAGHFTEMRYDGLDRMVYRARPEGITEESVWDDASRLVAYRDALGNETTWEYDALDRETGLVYARNRWYDPQMGRFVSPDPLGYVDGPSAYAFAANSPSNFGDPLGLQTDAELPDLLLRVQAAVDEAARRHGIKSWLDVQLAGEKGNAMHATLKSLLDEGGEYHHPRIATEVMTSELGTVLNFGEMERKKGSLVKDVVILKPGTTIHDIEPFRTRASDVTSVVLDLKIGKKGAKLREADTLKRFGVTNLVLRPFQDVLETARSRASSLRWARKVRGIPLLGMALAALSISDAAQAASEGDLDRSIEVLTGLDTLRAAAEAAGEEAWDTAEEKANALGISGEQRRKVARENGDD